MSAASADAKRRVKLYALNASRQWDDKGTGHVISCYHEPLDGISLLVRNESDGSLLLESKIHLETQYQKQQGTLIVWTESDNYDLALSFQEQDGCNEIWEKICQVQGRDPTYEHDNDEEEDIKIDLVECDHDKLQLISEQITAFSQTTRRRDALASEYIENQYIQKLLEFFRQADERQDVTTLHKLYEIFKQLFLYDRPTLTEVMLSEQNLLDVVGVFEYEPPQSPAQKSQVQENQQSEVQQQEEEEEQRQQKHQAKQEQEIDHQTKDTKPQEIQASVGEQAPRVEDIGDADIEEDKTALSADSDSQEPQGTHNTCGGKTKNKDQLLQDVKSDEKSLTNQATEMTKPPQPIELVRKRHRDYLLNGTVFKEVIPFGNQKLVDKIHQTYRVQYLQSSVLPAPSILEENAYSSLTNILFFNKVEIVSMIQENTEFLKELFNQIISNETSIDRKRELVSFLREYCIFSQSIQPKQRESFFKTLASFKILSAVEVALSSDDQVIKSAAIDIFTYLVEYSPHMTREHAVQQREGITGPPNSNAQTANILKLVIEHITTDQDPELGTATQLSCIIRLLLDPENMPGDMLAKNAFIEFFYYTCMQSLVEPIKNSTTLDGDIESSANDRKTAQLLSIMLELLTFFVEHHYCQFRSFLLSGDLLTRIISLIKSRHKFLVLGVIRFFRRLVATKDHVYLDLIMNEDLFSPIIQVLKNNNGRYNLLDSAILEMFEFIQNEELLPLMNHILTNFGPFLDSIDYVNTFKLMRRKKEALHDAIMDNTLKPNCSSIDDYSRRERDNIWFEQTEADVDDNSEVDTDKELDPDSGDATVDSGSDPDSLQLPDLDFTMNGSKNDDENVDDVEEDVEEDDDEDDIQMDEEECEDELEPQYKKKKTK